MAARSPEITQPVRIDPENLIQHVYAGPDGSPDDNSQAEFSQYLVDRMYGKEDEVARKYKPGAEIPKEGWVREGWILTPKKALALFLAANLALHAWVNGKEIVGKAGEITGDIAHMVDPKTRTLPATTKPPKKVTITRDFLVGTNGREQRSGIADRDILSAGELVKQIAGEQKRNKGEIKSVVITGSASDEWTANGIKSIGRGDEANRALALKRAKMFASSVEQQADKTHLDLPNVSVTAREAVLDNRSELGGFLADVQRSRYGSVLEAIAAYNRGDKNMSPSLRREIRRLIGSERVGRAEVTFVETIDQPGKPVKIPGKTVEIERKDTKHPMIPFIIPIVPIPRYRRRLQDPFEEPPIIEDEPLDKVWLELYEEALKPGGELVPNAWALSRKYQALYREERITQGLRYDYRGTDGKPRSINVLFTDRPKLDEAVTDAIDGLMLDISMMIDGRVGDSLDTIVVLPTENTGPQRPDKIGLGIDEQLHRNVAGIAIPVIGLVELHLPLKPTRKDIEKFNGLRWVLAHEVAGHFTDVYQKQARHIDRARSNRPGRTFTARDPWLGMGGDSYATTGRRRAVKIQQFNILPSLSDDGDEFIVNADSPLLAEAHEVRLRGQSPTIYGDESAGELHAEVAAAVTTEIPIPASQAGLPARALGEKAGYRVDAGLEHRFVSHIGAVANAPVLTWGDDRLSQHLEHFDGAVMNGTAELNGDASQNSSSEMAKNSPYQADEKRLKILARARR